MPDFLPTASLKMLHQRAAIIRSVRHFFESRQFLEVETPLLSHDIVVDRHLHPVGINKRDVTGSQKDIEARLWLQTSPEFCMKRLVAGGAEAIFQIGKAFRQSETGKFHNPEFTMLEWYRTGDEMLAGMELLADFTEEVIQRPRPKLMTYRDIFSDQLQVDPFSDSVKSLCTYLTDSGITVELSDEESNRDEVLNLLLSELVEPSISDPVIIYHWPATQSALAKVRDSEFPVAERFELYIDGFELANGYHELQDAEELQRRNSINNQLRIKDGNGLLPEQSRLLEAMQNGLPGCSGVALGIDRLVMLMTGASSIQEVITFPIDRA